MDVAEWAACAPDLELLPPERAGALVRRLAREHVADERATRWWTALSSPGLALPDGDPLDEAPGGRSALYLVVTDDVVVRGGRPALRRLLDEHAPFACILCDDGLDWLVFGTHERGLVLAGSTAHERGLAELVVPRKRQKLREALYHFRDFDPRWVRPAPEDVAATLRARGAPERCHVVSAHADLDGRSLPLADAVREVVASRAGTVLSCLPGRLAFFEGEMPGERCLIERPYLGPTAHGPRPTAGPT